MGRPCISNATLCQTQLADYADDDDDNSVFIIYVSIINIILTSIHKGVSLSFSLLYTYNVGMRSLITGGPLGLMTSSFARLGAQAVSPTQKTSNSCSMEKCSKVEVEGLIILFIMNHFLFIVMMMMMMMMISVVSLWWLVEV